MAGENKLFLVVKQDTVLQNTGYLVRATDMDLAKKSVDNGMYIEETATTTLDLIETTIVSITEISENGNGQER